MSGWSPRQGWCRVCSNEAAKVYQARRRAEIGDEAFRAEQKERTRKSRQKPEVREAGRQYAAAKGAAMRRLAAMHPRAFDVLLREERSSRGLDPDSRRGRR